MSLNWQAMEFSFAKGLNQKVDPRLIQAPELVRAVDVDFDNLGGLRLRKPYASIGANILGGGTISGCRRIYAVGDELILFTQTALYSWSSQRSAWVLKGTHLAIKVTEQPTFINTSNQDDADRAQVSGTVVYCWRQTITGVDEIFVAAQDSTTGAVLLAPTDVAPGVRPRLIALDAVIVLIYESGTGSLVARTISPATLAVSGTTTLLAAASFNSYYDAEKIPGSDSFVLACRRDVTTSYEIMKVTSALVVTTATKARTCDGPIAVACAPNGSVIQVARGNGTNIQGDLITTSTLADTAVLGSAIGSGTSTIYQITACSYDSSGPAGTFAVFWHSNQSVAAVDFNTSFNTITTGGVVGSAATLKRRLGIASRAFAYGGFVYVWLAFAGESSFSGASPAGFRAQLQNSYFLYRSDGLLCAKGVWQRGAGFRTIGSLPGVTALSSSSFAFCGGERRIIPLGVQDADGVTVQSGYADTGPRDITVTFDSNEARRCARLGQTLYIAGGGEVMQYDGRDLIEVGFHLYPHYFGAIEVPAGNLADGVYTLKTSWRYDNAKGERERSTSATTGQVTIAAGPNGISTTSWIPLYVTHKSGIAAESWRTAVAGLVFYKTTASDPTSLTNPNRYIENDPTAGTLPTFNDELADTGLVRLEPHPENGDELENLAPPAATLIAASADRLFLAGIPGEPNRLVYSKQRNDGSIAAFNDALTVLIPEAGGALTGLALLSETLVVFRETGIYAVDGSGFDNLGGGQNYQPRLISSDVGAVNHESIALTPAGLVFKSSKGWYRLGAPQAGALVYIGGPVRNYDSETINAAHVVESQHQVRIVTSGRVLVWDYLADAWFEWTIADGLHACVFSGTHHILATAAVRSEQSDWSTADYAMDVEMLIHLGQLQGFSRVQEVLVLGEYRSTHTLRVRAGSFTENSYFDDKTWTPSPTTVGGAMQFRHGPSQQQHAAIRIRLTSSATAGEKLRLSALSLKVGFKAPTYRHLPAAQKQ